MDKRRKDTLEEFMPMSQKASSLLWIEQNVSEHALPTILFRSFDLVREAVTTQQYPPIYPSFIRTCPSKACHGLMQSFRVGTPEEYLLGMRYLHQQMKKYGETQGTVAMQPYCESVANIVWAPGIMAIGPGNNGVTAGGRWPVITINAPAPDFYPQAIHDLEVPEAEIEMVVDRDLRVWVTQVRHATGHFTLGAPPANAIPGFLHKTPLNISKCRLITMRNLMDIDELCCQEELRPGEDVIVSHPYGSVLSHAAAWCRQKGYSYAITDLPKHLSSAGDGRDVWLHEPSRGWLVSCDETEMPATPAPIDCFRGSYFHGLEQSLQVCDLDELRSSWVAALPFELYASKRVVTRELAILAGIFTGTMLRTIVAMSIDAVWRLCPNAVAHGALGAAVRYGLDVSPCNIGDVIETTLSFFGYASKSAKSRNRVTDVQLRQWRLLLTTAAAMMSAHAGRDWDRTVTTASNLLGCLRDMRQTLKCAFGGEDFFAASDIVDPATNWVKMAQVWTKCLLLLQHKNRHTNASISGRAISRTSEPCFVGTLLQQRDPAPSHVATT